MIPAMDLTGARVTVVGAGIGGMATALLLARVGAAVTLLERSAEIRAVGAGILLQPNGLAVLLELKGRKRRRGPVRETAVLDQALRRGDHRTRWRLLGRRRTGTQRDRGTERGGCDQSFSNHDAPWAGRGY